jgi:hypothetical protein
LAVIALISVKILSANHIEAPFPELDDLLTMMGEAGHHLAEIEASEGAAGTNFHTVIHTRSMPLTF